ncbi:MULTISPECIES: hypothetical protein [unclassified Aurantimonas]|uniref:hypothetical protein n=1 Tax=unclassified Aurantimonas TaxID=2638230 RepID=UPI002E17334D|nr:MULTISPECIES: hypothetical protein [unclassified Aurantimonas]MEC5291587.1 hypothetical protein [Aurantimonas sp. C2-3-R2]MEC5412671.1 hypothetical protein [Aurantimonas sp. C2-4-R8]
MQIANVLVSLAGDHRNTVPKLGVTAAEIPVLQAIHGADAVREIEPAGEIKRSNREERDRLVRIYRAKEGRSPVEQLYPGIAARVFETLDELGLNEEFFKAERRLRPNSAPSKSAKKSASAAKTAAAAEEADDGIGEMSDASAFA